ncbi:MAG: aminotransferase class V-fold PLP-dependent enzyme [Porticoccaceae bacterium]|nr:aminotransferase class V-fold PLP-dependent enzyme [Porticoccaceae bacterium]
MTLHNSMHREQQSKALLEQAKGYAYEYADSVAQRNVFPSKQAVADLEQFVEDLPTTSGDATAILQQLHQYGSPATTAQTGGRYFGFVNGGILPVTLATKWLSDFWDQNTALYVMSPIASKLEEVCEGWLRQLFGLPDNTVAGFVSGTSSAILCGLAAARYRLLQNQGWDFNRQGHNGAPPLRIIAGRHTHGAVIKAIAMLGFGIDNIEWIEGDDQGRILPQQFPELDSSCIILLQAGNVNSGSFDPFDEICDSANRAGAWIHIDGAFGLWAGGTKRLKHLTKGIEKAHSWSVDGHKTLNTPYDSGILLCRDKEALVSALQATGAYLTSCYSENRDGMLYTPEMSRRARAVELWAALKYLGAEGVDQLVYGMHERALQFANELRVAGFGILNDVVFNQVIVSPADTDTETDRIMAAIQDSGECWVGGSVWQGKKVIRVSVCAWVTSPEDVRRSVQAFIRARETITEQ